MKLHLFSFTWTAAAAAAFAFVGCNGETVGEPGAEITTVEDAPPDTLGEEGHDHPTEGPHGGDLIELGEHEYHGEIVHEGNAVTVYILDSAVEEAVPIEASEVTINLKHDGQPEQFRLAAAPQEGDGEGKSSRFTIEDADLASHLDAEDAGARLMVTIAGKSFNGAIEHHHGHEGHDHEH